jgi:hypothetical protein
MVILPFLFWRIAASIVLCRTRGLCEDTGKSAGAQPRRSSQRSAVSQNESHQAARKGLAQTCYFSLLIRRAGYARIRQPSGVRWCLIFENLGIQQSAFSVQSKLEAVCDPLPILSALGDIG